jgi:hypothetical protein
MCLYAYTRSYVHCCLSGKGNYWVIMLITINIRRCDAVLINDVDHDADYGNGRFPSAIGSISAAIVSRKRRKRVEIDKERERRHGLLRDH